MPDESFFDHQFIEIDLLNPCLESQYEHISALLNPSARRILAQNNFTKLYYFYMHACIVNSYDDRLLQHYKTALGDRGLHSSEALLLDCSLEGNYQVDETLERLCVELGAQRYQIIVVSQGRVKDNPQRTVFYNQSHYDIVSGKSRGRIDAALENRMVSLKDFVCLNNFPRPHRIALVAYLWSRGLHTHNLISFTFRPVGEDGLRPCSLEDNAKSSMDNYSSLENQIKVFLNGIQSSDLVIPEPQEDKKFIAYSTGTPWNIYANSRFSIITESDFFCGNSDGDVRVTEKVYKSIAVGHPFILAGSAGSLEHLKELGFKSFTPLINEDYDNPGNLDDRMLAICRSIDFLLSDLENSVNIYEELIELAACNRRHLMSGGLQEKVVSLYNSTLSQYFAFWRG